MSRAGTVFRNLGAERPENCWLTAKSTFVLLIDWGHSASSICQSKCLTLSYCFNWCFCFKTRISASELHAQWQNISDPEKQGTLRALRQGYEKNQRNTKFCRDSNLGRLISRPSSYRRSHPLYAFRFDYWSLEILVAVTDWLDGNNRPCLYFSRRKTDSMQWIPE